MKSKKIAILSCLKATEVCSGIACFNALNQRTKSFSIYQNDSIEVIAFFHCNGCECDYDKDISYLEKIETLIRLKPDIVHVGKCTMIDDQECSVISNIIKTFELNDIVVVRGTH